MDSKDRRTKRQKLEDMARQTASPNEAEIARKKLEELPTEAKVSNFKVKKADVYADGVKVGEAYEVEFNFNDIPSGFYDFSKDEWVWSDGIRGPRPPVPPRGSGT